jgi:hypothetical protein
MSRKLNFFGAQPRLAEHFKAKPEASSDCAEVPKHLPEPVTIDRINTILNLCSSNIFGIPAEQGRRQTNPPMQRIVVIAFIAATLP